MPQKYIDIDDFLLSSYKYFTYGDMAEQLGISITAIRNKCQALGIVPITQGEQTYQFLLARKDRKTIPELAKMTGMTEGGLRQYFWQHKWKAFVKPEEDNTTAGKILSEYKIGMETDNSREYYLKVLNKSIAENGIENIPIE